MVIDQLTDSYIKATKENEKLSTINQIIRYFYSSWPLFINHPFIEKIEYSASLPSEYLFLSIYYSQLKNNEKSIKYAEKSLQSMNFEDPILQPFFQYIFEVIISHKRDYPETLKIAEKIANYLKEKKRFFQLISL